MNINEIKDVFDQGAEGYDAQRRSLIPGFDAFYTTSVSILKFYRAEFANIIDLGAGSGLLTGELYKLYPDSRFTLVDVSSSMMALAKERFKGLTNFDYVDANYAENLPDISCDLIASAVSIHHLETSQKLRLYKNIYDKLPQGGVFLNLDQFHASSPAINSLYTAWWDDFINKGPLSSEQKAATRGRRKLDREESIDATLEALRNCGFESVDCIYHFMKFGVVLAIK
jgi:ubiquinone/menaquinone biosynthesis C-methylase UbiE